MDCLVDQAGGYVVTSNTVEHIRELTLGISIARICRPQKLALIGRRGELDSERDRIGVSPSLLSPSGARRSEWAVDALLDDGPPCTTAGDGEVGR